MMRERTGTSGLGPLFSVVGSVVAALGCLPTWFKIRADLSSVGGAVQTETVNGLKTNDGKIFISIAVILIVLGLAMLVVKGRGGRRALGLIVFLGSAFVGGFALYDALTPKSQAIDEAARSLGARASLAEVKQVLEGLFDQGIVRIDVQIGLWLVVAGAAVALMGALLALFSRTPAAQAAGTPGMPGTRRAAPAPTVPPPSAPGEPGPDVWTTPAPPPPPPGPEPAGDEGPAETNE